MKQNLVIIILIIGLAITGCSNAAKTKIVAEVDQAAGVELEKDPSGSRALAWFNSHKDFAQKIFSECQQNTLAGKGAIPGSEEAAICGNAGTGSLRHHYDNVI